MIQEYKVYAQDLYKIKISTLPVSLIESPLSLTNLLVIINELRPQLRRNLAELSAELRQNNITLPDTLKEIEVVNNILLEKLYNLACSIKRKIKH